MKRSITALELYYLVKELQVLINGRINQIYMADPKEIYLQCHVTSIGKKIIRVQAPSFIYLTTYKPSIETPPAFCLYLRRRLVNARIRAVKQLGFERAIELELETKDTTYYLIIELFAKGNIILCDNNRIILSQSELQDIGGRKIAPKEPYPVPEKGYSVLKITESMFNEAAKKTTSMSLVKMLATDFGLGGVYAEETCLLAGVDKNTEPVKVKKAKEIVKAIKSLLTKKLSPLAVYKNSELKDIVPFRLKVYEGFDQKQFKTYNEAFDSPITEISQKEAKLGKMTKSEKELQKLKTIIEHQSATLKKLQHKEKQLQHKATAIYENYQLIQDTIKQISEAAKKYTWAEIKDKLKKHKLVKSVDAKNKTVTLEL